MASIASDAVGCRINFEIYFFVREKWKGNVTILSKRCSAIYSRSQSSEGYGVNRLDYFIFSVRELWNFLTNQNRPIFSKVFGELSEKFLSEIIFFLNEKNEKRPHGLWQYIRFFPFLGLAYYILEYCVTPLAVTKYYLWFAGCREEWTSEQRAVINYAYTWSIDYRGYIVYIVVARKQHPILTLL